MSSDAPAADTAVTTRSVGEWFLNMPITRTHWLAGLTLFMALVIESWEMMIIIFSSGAIATDFDLTTRQTGSLIGAMFIGMIPGALLWGKLMGPMGRRQCLLWSIGLYGLFPLMSAFAPSFEALWVCGPGLIAIGNVKVLGAFQEPDIVVCAMELQDGTRRIQRRRNLGGHASPQSPIRRRLIDATDQGGKPVIEGDTRWHGEGVGLDHRLLLTLRNPA